MSLSPMSGSSYLDGTILSRPIDPLLFSVYRGGIHEALDLLKQCWRPDHSPISTTGTDSWESQGVEWLRINILMGLEGTPGRHTPDVPTAYTWISRNLVSPQSLDILQPE